MPRLIFLILALCIFAGGCQAAHRIGKASGKVMLAVPYFVAEGLVEGLFDSDETFSEEITRNDKEDAWKRYWRANPDVNPKMTEAFAND